MRVRDPRPPSPRNVFFSFLERRTASSRSYSWSYFASTFCRCLGILGPLVPGEAGREHGGLSHSPSLQARCFRHLCVEFYLVPPAFLPLPNFRAHVSEGELRPRGRWGCLSSCQELASTLGLQFNLLKPPSCEPSLFFFPAFSGLHAWSPFLGPRPGLWHYFKHASC